MSYSSLKIFKRDQLLKIKIFTDDQISIGSSEGLNLQLDGLSPWHALIEKKHDVFCILDLNSETGTLLNGQKITEETPLPSGSFIHIGPYKIQFFIGPPADQKGQAPAVPSGSKNPLDSSEPRAPIDPADPVAPAKPAVPADPAIPAKPVAPADPVIPAQAGIQPASVSQKGESFAVPSAAPLKPHSPLAPAKKRPSKPQQKGFWNTYAPVSPLKNLDDFIEPSIGNLIEVILCWKERVLSTHHFFKTGDVFMGSGKSCQIKFPHMLGQAPYKLLSIVSGAKIYLRQGIKGLLFQGKEKSTRSVHNLSGDQTVILKPYEMVRLDFNDSLKVYVRLMDKPPKPPIAGLFNLKLSEVMALFLAVLLTGLLLFYGTLYAPAFLTEDTKFIEKDIRVAKVVFKKRETPKEVVKYDLGEKTKKATVQKKKPKVTKKKASSRAKKLVKKRKKKKPVSTPRKGKQGKMAGQAPGKKPKVKKVTVGSVRPGGSLKTGKKGSSAKTVAPDPTKVGLLGAFGGGGKLSRLDKGASGQGGLLGLAERSTGFAGTKESYEGEGIGTKTKDLGAGGRGSSLVGISGIKTKGKGLGYAGTGRGGLGKRGRMNIEFGSEDIDVAGEIDREAILQAIRRNQSKFQRCYQMGLNQKPSMQGKLGMEWLISPSGKGQKAKAFNNPMGSRILANCVAGVLERLNFPEPPAGQWPKITFTFTFYL